MKSLLPLFILALLSACDTAKKSAAPAPAAVAMKSSSDGDGVIEVVFLQMNDVYEISPLSDNSGGLARVASLRKTLLAQNPNTFTLLSGDFISPSVIGTLKHEGKRIRGKQMVETLNALGLDWVVFGNHEFDYDDLADLQARLDESQFTWIGGNARLVTDTEVKPFFKNRPAGPEPCPDNFVVNLKDADGTTLKLGVFGVLISTGRKPYVDYEDVMRTAKKSMDVLRSKADVSVAITHLGISDDLQLAEALPELPLIMGGHDHDNMMHHVGATTVAKADANARTVYVHTLRFDKKNKQATVRSELRKIDNALADEPATAAVVAKWDKIKTESLASSGFDATKAVTNLKTPLDCRESVIRQNQAPVGGIIGSAMLAAAKHKPDCALFNSGSVRVDDVLAGTLLEIDIVRMLPFGGGITEADMRGSLLLKTLNTGWTNKGSGGYLQWEKIKREASGNWLINGMPLDENKIYRVVLPDFLLTGNENKMSFLKTTLNADGKTTSNPDVPALYKPDPKDKADLRNDIRLALIQYWRG